MADPKRTTLEATRFLGLGPTRYVEPSEAQMDVNTSTPADKSMDEESFQFLRAAYRDEMRDLSNLLNRDVTGWLDTSADAIALRRAA